MLFVKEDPLPVPNVVTLKIKSLYKSFERMRVYDDVIGRDSTVFSSLMFRSLVNMHFMHTCQGVQSNSIEIDTPFTHRHQLRFIYSMLIRHTGVPHAMY